MFPIFVTLDVSHVLSPPWNEVAFRNAELKEVVPVVSRSPPTVVRLAHPEK